LLKNKYGDRFGFRVSATTYCITKDKRIDTMTNERKRKSEKMTQMEWSKFRGWVDNFDVFIDACESLSVSRPTMERLLFKGSGHPDTIAKIRAKINA
jgi:hypothetical protein